MVPLTALGLLLLAASVALVFGSGVSRFSAPDDPTMLWVGLAIFAAGIVVALVVRVMAPDKRPFESSGAIIWGSVLVLVGLAVGIGLDIGN